MNIAYLTRFRESAARARRRLIGRKAEPGAPPIDESDSAVRPRNRFVEGYEEPLGANGVAHGAGGEAPTASDNDSPMGRAYIATMIDRLENRDGKSARQWLDDAKAAHELFFPGAFSRKSESDQSQYEARFQEAVERAERKLAEQHRARYGGSATTAPETAATENLREFRSARLAEDDMHEIRVAEQERHDAWEASWPAPVRSASANDSDSYARRFDEAVCRAEARLRSR